MKRLLLATLLLLAACVGSVYGPRPVRVASAEGLDSEACELVGEIPIGMAMSTTAPDHQRDLRDLENSLRSSAVRHAQLYDADLLVFEASDESEPGRASLSCSCRAYRCNPAPLESKLPTTLESLVSNPERYYGRLVAVEAWGVVQFETAGLFGSSQVLEEFEFEEAVGLSAPESSFSHLEFPYAGDLYVVGVFQPAVYPAGYAGQIAVYRIEVRR